MSDAPLRPQPVVPHLGALVLCCLSTAAAAGNFTATDPLITSAAEQARIDSAMFWTGRELPGRWSTPCSIEVTPASHDGGGATRFQFDRGEVSGWSMSISGRRQALLADVIPHEVDHMVRASLVRRPIPRWLDEGCAALMESPESHRRLRQDLRAHSGVTLSARFLDGLNYPTGSSELARLYSVGHALVEYLLQRRDAATLLAFQQDPRPPSQKLADFYGLDPAGLDQDWHRWCGRRQAACDCRSAHCPRHDDPSGENRDATESSHPRESVELLVFTSEWCGPCRRFWSDWRRNEAFRSRLEQAFRIRVVDIDREPLVAREHGIDCVPTFLTPDLRLAGYEGPDWLNNRLFAPDSATQPAPVPTSPPEPAKPLEFVPPPPHDAPVPPLSPALPVVAPRPVAPSSLSVPAVSKADQPTTTAAPTDVPHPGWTLIWTLATGLWPWLQLTGLVGGSLATGGVVTVVAGLLWRVIRRRWSRRRSASRTSPESSGGGAARPAPFPRQLDEARQLLELRQSEGRVAVLDALRGMFLDDEIQKTLSTGDPGASAPLTRLLDAIDARVNEVAPLSVES